MVTHFQKVVPIFQMSSDEQNLQELFKRFGLTPDMPPSEIRDRLRDNEHRVRKEIQTELKVKEGAENMRRAYSDRKSVANVGTMIKNSVSRIDELNQELEDVRTLLLMTDDGGTPNRPIGNILSFFFLASFSVLHFQVPILI
jgi:serine/threonine-protein kinase N1